MRRAAVSKLGTVAVLGEVIRQDSDAEVRDEASGVLLDIALGAYEASETVSLAAVDGLVGLPPAEAQKQLVLVAKTARREAVARRALEALGDDPRAIGTTARRSEHAAIRLEADVDLVHGSRVVRRVVDQVHRAEGPVGDEPVRREDLVALGRRIAVRGDHRVGERLG